ncbi:hypothetical protein KI387_019161, partial [Taxus chinensis]
DQLDRVSYRLARSCLDNVNIKADCLPIHQVAKQPGEVLINSIESMACFQDHELDATTMLQNLETWHQENADRFDYGKDLQTYLKYCKDVIFSGAKMSYKEEILVKHFWELYEKLEKEDLDPIQGFEGDASLDLYISNTRQKNISQSVDENNASLYQRDCNLISNVAELHYPESGAVKQDVETTLEEIPSWGSPLVKAIGGDRLGSIISDMEQNRFQYIPPTRSRPPESYLSYRKKNIDGKFQIFAHADYYILLRACASAIKVNAYALHKCILKIEKRLGCIEDRIAGILKENL